MAKDILRNVRLFTGGCDLTGQSNKVGWEPEDEEKDVTTFGSTDAAGTRIAKEVMAGLSSTKLTAAGFWEAGDTGKVDDALWAARGGVGAWTIFPVSATEGDLAYLTQALQGSYQLGGAVGDVAPWQASMTGSQALARGKSVQAPGTARTATGTGTIVDLGAAVPAGKRLHASLHVLSVAGTSTPTITATVQSAALVGFAGPTNRIVFSAATARGSQYAVVDGPITDQFYRLSFTISGTGPSFLIAAAVGID
jgi:hypothetical protein